MTRISPPHPSSGFREQSQVPAFGELFSGMVDNLGTSAFHASLRTVLQSITYFDCCIILSYSPAQAPTLLEQQSTMFSERYQCHYFTDAYNQDPFYRAALRRLNIGVSRCHEIAEGDFSNSSYFNSYYKYTGLVDEIGMLCPIDEATVHISLGRYQGSEPFEDVDLQLLGRTQVLLYSLIRKHASLTPAIACKLDPIGGESSRPGDNLFARFQVTRREAEVASLILKGHTNTSISHVLGISEETVKVHRKRLYAKLSISSQAELFMMFMGMMGRTMAQYSF